MKETKFCYSFHSNSDNSSWLTRLAQYHNTVFLSPSFPVGQFLYHKNPSLGMWYFLVGTVSLVSGLSSWTFVLSFGKFNFSTVFEKGIILLPFNSSHS